jgi:hypothetical protein
MEKASKATWKRPARQHGKSKQGNMEKVSKATWKKPARQHGKSAATWKKHRNMEKTTQHGTTTVVICKKSTATQKRQSNIKAKDQD